MEALHTREHSTKLNVLEVDLHNITHLKHTATFLLQHFWDGKYGTQVRNATTNDHATFLLQLRTFHQPFHHLERTER